MQQFSSFLETFEERIKCEYTIKLHSSYTSYQTSIKKNRNNVFNA